MLSVRLLDLDSETRTTLIVGNLTAKSLQMKCIGVRTMKIVLYDCSQMLYQNPIGLSPISLPLSNKDIDTHVRLKSTDPSLSLGQQSYSTWKNVVEQCKSVCLELSY